MFIVNSMRFILVSIIFFYSFQFRCTSQTKNNNSFLKAESFADSIISILSLEEKIGLLHGMGGENSEFGDLEVQFFGIKGNEKYGIPSFHMGHGITGVRSGRDTSIHATYFCSPIAMGCAWNPDLYSEVGSAIAHEMRALGQDLNLGPTLNIIRHPLGGRNWESFSEDPFLTAKMAVSFVQAMQSNGIICGPKHFVANNQEKNRFDINNIVDERTLREIYLPAFKAAVTEGGALNIMGAYNRLNGTYMCHNKYLLNDILRDEWGFQGFTLSDFAYGIRSTVEPVNAGMNVEMHRPKYYGETMLNAVKNGQIEEERIDTLLKDVLKVMHFMNLFNRNRYEYPDIVHNNKHIEICRKVAQQSPILLKNEDSILPIDTSQLKSIAIIGPNAKRFPSLSGNRVNYSSFLQGGGSGRMYYYKKSVVEPFEGIINAFKETIQVNYSQGCQTPDLFFKNKTSKLNEIEKKLIEEAVNDAKESEMAIIYAGLSGFNESEGWDRKSIRLPGQQNNLIREVAKANSNTIVVLIAGSCVDVEPWIDKIKALIYVPYCGEQIGNGIADIIAGKVSPSGKLPFTWVKSINDYPKISIFKGKGFSEEGKSNNYSEGIFVGYRYFDKHGIDARFPFGYGLSYTQFEYSNLKVDHTAFPVKVKVNITNKGSFYGADVIQVYLSSKNSKVEKANKELKGFKKVDLKPGEVKNIEIELNKNAFAYYNVKQKKWIIEKGEYEISIGKDSKNLMLKDNFGLFEEVLKN